MTQARQHIFVDESGGTDLPNEESGVGDYYVIAGVIIPADSHAELTRAAEQIVSEHAGTGELKSSSIGGNTDRRRRVLQDIARHKFAFYSLVVNKARIWRDSGLQWRPSFYKFLHRMFYAQIKRAFLEVEILADQHGRSAFMESFKTYISDLGSLFDTFEFASSRANPPLQLADVIAGTIRRVYTGEESREILEILGHPRLPVEEWPPRASWDNDLIETSQFDEAIRGISLRAARSYVESHIGSDDIDDQLRAHAFRYLLIRFEEDPQEYVLRSEVLEYLRSVTRQNMTETTLTSKVFADARDSGVIIASTDAGVKIPYDASDLREWMARTESQVAPYLRRVEEARRIILLASHNQHDIAAATSFPALSRYLGNT